jgi:two-component system sensor histidine kinase KdpD
MLRACQALFGVCPGGIQQTGDVMLTDPSVDFLSVAAHEFRLPVTHIKGFVSTLRRRDMDLDEATRSDFLAEIEHETDRLTQLIDDLLDRPDEVGTGARRSRRRPVPPAALIAGGLDRVRGLLDGRSVEIEVAADLPPVEVDAPAMERVIANLVHNAVKYAHPNGRIRLSARVTGDALAFFVEDDGPGLQPRERQRIFRGHYRGQSGSSSGLPGAGLGLTICLAIVSAHGGRIWADGRPGGGARFVTVLPLRASQPLEERGSRGATALYGGRHDSCPGPQLARRQTRWSHRNR